MIEQVRVDDYALIEPLAILASECFKNDPFYTLLHKNESKRIKMIQSIFQRSLKISLEYGFIIAHREDNRFISLSSWIDYNYLRHSNSEDFNFIFKPEQSNRDDNPAAELTMSEFSVIEKLTHRCPLSMYMVSICVHPEYRRKGLASSLVKGMVDRLPQYTFFSDISNPDSVSIYTGLGFEIMHEMDGISFVKHSPVDTTNAFEDIDKIPIAIPASAIEVV